MQLLIFESWDIRNSLRKNPAFGILVWTAYKSENNNYTVEEKEE